jgi:2-polyprenyl-3-methyl-5-hydroxy-6-metoxy-1,4-benzoquinol methylase
MADNHIHSVVDAGCGDWEFSQTVDWTGIDYRGFDIVDTVVAADNAKYAKANVHFFAANIVDADLPPADLLIVKDVLQHLPSADVAKFLTQTRKYKHALVINGVTPVSMSARNVDITMAEVQQGAYRNLDITRPPFNVAGDKPLTWWSNGNMHQVVHLTTDPSWRLDGASR